MAVAPMVLTVQALLLLDTQQATVPIAMSNMQALEDLNLLRLVALLANTCYSELYLQIKGVVFVFDAIQALARYKFQCLVSTTTAI
jgi:hypothetical protein